MPRAVARSRAARGGAWWRARGVPHALWAASVAALGHALLGGFGAVGEEPAPQCTVPNTAPLTSPSADISSVL